MHWCIEALACGTCHVRNVGAVEYRTVENKGPKTHDRIQLHLIADVRKGVPILECIVADVLPGNRYRLVYSPGLVQGLAAGDEFELIGSEQNHFRLLQRSGNVCVQWYFWGNVEKCRSMLTKRCDAIGGCCDGDNAREGGGTLVFTFPIRVGFAKIEAVFNQAREEFPESEWYYGNVFDPADGTTPLNWWAK